MTQASPVISWPSLAPITYPTPLSIAQQSATANVAGTFQYQPAVGTLEDAGTQTLTLTFQPSDAKDYTSTSATTTIVVNKGTPSVTWSAPASIAAGTALSPTQLNATANTTGTFTYSPAVGAVLPAGTQTLNVTFTPTDTSDYTTAQASVPLTVTQVVNLSTQTPAPYYFGQPVELIASLPVMPGTTAPTGTMAFTEDGAPLGKPIPLSNSTALLTVSNLTLGQHVFTASYSGDSLNQPASSSPLNVTIGANPTTTSVTLSPITSTQGLPVMANVIVAAAGGTVATAGGAVSCTATPPTGSAVTATATLNGKSTLADVVLSGLPETDNQSPTTYSVVCSFTSADTTEFGSSDSTANPTLGTVTSAVAAKNSPAGSLLQPRAGHTATQLPDGTVLVTGGTYGHDGTDNPSTPLVLQSAELWLNGSFVQAAPMTGPRWRHTATLLNDGSGQVLITGGSNGSSALNTAELFTPGAEPGAVGVFNATTVYNAETDDFTGPVSTMNAARYLHTATLLSSGKVLLSGGQTTGGGILNTAEVYDPTTGIFTLTGPMSTPRWMHTATLLADGTVLIAGGSNGGSLLSSAEVYNPATNQFTVVSGMLQPRAMAQATLLGNGSVLITGGAGTGCGGGYPNLRTTNCALSEAELYSSGSFTQVLDKASGAVQNMQTPRYMHTATVLYDSTVLIAGGVTFGENDSSAAEEIFNPATGDFVQLPTGLIASRYQHTATLLANSGVLIIGGEAGQSVGYDPVGEGGGYEPGGPSSEIYAATGASGALHPKFVILDVMYAPPGSGSSMNYNEQSMVGNNSSSTNSFTNGLTLNASLNLANLGHGTKGPGNSNTPADTNSSTTPATPKGPFSFNLGSITAGGSYTYSLSNNASYGLTTTTGDSISVPGPTNSGLGVDHEADIVWVWLNPETDYTLAPGSGPLVWNGYATNNNDPNVVAGQMDIIPLTVGQLDGTSPIPTELQEVLDRNWDPLSNGGAGGLTQADLQTILARDPFATNATQSGRSTLPTNQPSVPQIPIYDPNIPTVDPISGVCGGRYTFDPVTGQTFPYGPLDVSSNGSSNTDLGQALTSTYTVNSTNTQTWSKFTTDTYSVGLSLSLGKAGGAGGSGGSTGATGATGSTGSTGTTGAATQPAQASIWNALMVKVSEMLTFVNSWNPTTNNQSSNTQTLTIKSPLTATTGATTPYTGPNQMQIWKDNLYGTYMFYPRPNDTTITVQTSQATVQSGSTVLLTATVMPDPSIHNVPSGTVTFYDGCTVLGGGPVPLTNGAATLPLTLATQADYTPEVAPLMQPIPIRPPGGGGGGPPPITTQSHTIRALYSGDNVFFHNVGNTLTQVVTSGVQPYLALSNGISPASASIGTSVTLNGGNFGTTGAVSFNGIAATVTSWSANTIVAAVPAGATSGPVYVTVGTAQSNSLPFVVTQPNAGSTTATLVLSPQTSWSGYTVIASVQVTAQGGVYPAGSVSCASSPSSGTGSNTVGTINTSTGIAQVSLVDLPPLYSGSSSTSYSETCTFSPSDPTTYSSSQSNTLTGTIVPVPPPIISVGPVLANPRQNPQATMLNDGTVLVTGGDEGKYAGESEDGPYLTFLQSTEIYSGSGFTLAADMTTARSLHQATLLSNSTGQVLITGGINGSVNGSGTPLASAELFTPGSVAGAPGSFAPTTQYDPAAGQFTTTSTAMNTPRYWHTATLLPSGKVLIVGGASSLGNYNPNANSYTVTAGANGTAGSSLNSAELYNPATGQFTYTTGSMSYARSRHTATLLQDGTVLIAGGIDNSGNAISTAEIYNPVTDSFALLNSAMAGGRIKAAATRLQNGTVLISGGSVGAETNGGCPSFRTTSGCVRADADIYDPVLKTFSPTASKMSIARYAHTSTVLYDGTVLISGGLTNWYSYNGDGDDDTAYTEEVYNPATNTFGSPVAMAGARYNQASVLLPTAGVLLVGGAGGDIFGALPMGFQNSAPSTEFFSPATQSSGVHPKYMVLNIMYAPPGSGSSVQYTNSTLTGTSMTQTQTKDNALSLSLAGTIGIANIGATAGYTFDQNSTVTYGLNTTTTQSTTVLGPSSSGVGVDHEADVVWIWLNPESDFTITNPGTPTTPMSAAWTGYATNQADTNVAQGQMDIVPLTVAQLDGTYPIPQDLREILDRNWDPVSGGGAGGITAADIKTILARDPFAVNTSGGTSAAPTNVPVTSTYPLAAYPVVDPNVPTVDQNDPNKACGRRFDFDSNQGQTLQYAALGSTNQPLSQNYQLQSNTTQGSGQNASDTYYVSLSVGVCFGIPNSNGGNQCSNNPTIKSGTNPNGKGGKTDITISFSISDQYSWGHKWGNTNNGQTLSTQALTIKNPVPSDNYNGPAQVQVWKDNLFGTFMFYPKPTDTLVTLLSSATTIATGNQVTFSAAVTPTASSSGQMPTGQVTFYDGCTVLGTPQTLVNGSAAVTTTMTGVQTHNILAVYSGDSVYFHNDAPGLNENVVDDSTNLPYILPNGLNPASGPTGTNVTISGQNFGSTGTVNFNGVAATVSSWSAGSILATVPTGATTGPVTVNANGISSNSQIFTVTTAPTTTIATLTLGPAVAWPGSSVIAHTVVMTSNGTVPQGTVSCTLNGAASGNAASINQATSAADVVLTGLPSIPSGSTSVTYTVNCVFTSTTSGYSGSQSNQATGTISSAPGATDTAAISNLLYAREYHQANLLADGTVLFTGGQGNAGALADTEIYSGGRFTQASTMAVAREGHQATTLGNSTGQVLVTGGTDGAGNVFASAELFTPSNVPGGIGAFSSTLLYDPAAQAFTTTVTTLKTARSFHTATLLPSGKVLVAGGKDASGNPIASAELFDPVVGNFTSTTGSLQVARYSHTATLLSDGTVLLAGGTGLAGTLSSAEIYNPANDTFSLINSNMISPRTGATATPVVSFIGTGPSSAVSQVLFTGGENGSTVLKSAELYTVSTAQFASTQDSNGPTTMNAARLSHTATLLVDGTVLLAGGQDGSGYQTSEEIYNPLTGDFSLLSSSLVTGRANQSATLLPGGTVLLAGGYGVAHLGGLNGNAVCPIQPDSTEVQPPGNCGPGNPPPPPPQNEPGILSSAEVFSTNYGSGTLYPKFMVLDVLYAPPGVGSTMTYSNSTAVGSSMSTSSTFSYAQTATLGVVASLGSFVTISPTFGWGHTFTQSGSSNYAFTTTTQNSIVVPGPVKAGTAGTTGAVSTGVDHESDIIEVWLNPASSYTGTPSPTGNALVWNGYGVNPNDPNVAVGAMDVVQLTVSQLDGTSPIPPGLRAALDRNWDPTATGGAGALQLADFQTVLQRDPFATNLSLNGSAAPQNSASYFDPNVPTADPLANNTCSTRYSFDPVLGQTIPFGQLGSSNQPITQTYSLQNQTQQMTSSTTTDQYSVETAYSLMVGVPDLLSVNASESTKMTWTNVHGGGSTSTTTAGQQLSIKNPATAENYNGPTQIQVWKDNIYGTFMFYPKAADTAVILSSSESSAGPEDSVLLTVAVIPDPKVAASANPPLTPTGLINFYDGCTLLGSQAINPVTGMASMRTSALSPGTHTLLATYTGDSNFQHNTSGTLAVVWNTSGSSTPFISSTSVNSGSIGAPVTITGVNFGNAGTVVFNGTQATISSWSPTSVAVTVPSGATTGPLVLTTGGTTSNGVEFGVVPASGNTSTTVTLSPGTLWSGYPLLAQVAVAGAGTGVPTGAVSCMAASSQSSGTPTSAVALDPTGATSIHITDLPVVPFNGQPVPFTIACNYVATGGFASSQSAAVGGTVVPPPTATQMVQGSLNVPRENEQVNLLEDGTVLVTGGDNGAYPIAAAEIFSSGSFASIAPMTSPRTGHQATLLVHSTGQVLVTGGSNGSSSALSSAELFTAAVPGGEPAKFLATTSYNPAAQVFTNNVTQMTTARINHSATELNTGQVLIVGGTDASGNVLASAELFDPKMGTFTALPISLETARTGHTATLLLNGTVLIAGGSNGNGAVQTAEIYDPVANTFTYTKTGMMAARQGSQATRLGNGTVLFTGGQFGSATAEIYNPATVAFGFTVDAYGNQSVMAASRSFHTATLLYDNTVLIAGGEDSPGDTLISEEIYDPVSGTFTPAQTTMQGPRHNGAAVLLPVQPTDSALIEGALLLGGENSSSSGSTVEANAELYSPVMQLVGVHPKYMVANIQYAPPGSGSTLTYTDTSTVGNSIGTENSFTTTATFAYSVGVNLGILSFKDTTTRTWIDTQDNTATYSNTGTTTETQVIPGPSSSNLGVEHESDIVWLWLNPVANYSVLSPQSIVWNGFGVDSNDTNVNPGAMDLFPLTIAQLDGTAPISQAEWDVLDRNWDPVNSGGAGPLTAADLKTILVRDPFATNLSGVGRATAPTIAAVLSNQYTVFDPAMQTLDVASGSCGNRYDFVPGFNMTFPFNPLGNDNSPITQSYTLGTTNTTSTGSTTTDTYSVSISGNASPSFQIPQNWTSYLPTGLKTQTPTDAAKNMQVKNVISLNLSGSGEFKWTNKWTTNHNNSTLEQQVLSIKSPKLSDNYTGPGQIQVWKDNLYGTFMFYPRPSDTSWVTVASQTSVGTGQTVSLTASVTADPSVAYEPTGTVTFYDGCTVLGTATLNVATGTATITATMSNSGLQNIQAIYSGDANFFHNNAGSVSITVQ